VKILVVDDSVVFRTQISASLKDLKGAEVIGTAANGKIALGKLETTNVDLITLDMEMPEMNGLETIKAIKAKGYKVKIIVFSSQTTAGAQSALEALKLGADDVVSKPSGEVTSFELAQEMIKNSLLPRVQQFLNFPTSRLPKATPVTTSSKTKTNLTLFQPKAVVIASSTGGPNALETLFSQLQTPYRIPIFIVQHMPPIFTKILADRLTTISGCEIREAVDGEVVAANRVYVAPGDYHMVLVSEGDNIKISLNKEAQRNSVRPCADFLFESASEIYKDRLLGVVLTGMGEDGADGARMIKKRDGGIVIQNQESCVVYGMPGAVFAHGDFDEIKDISEMGLFLREFVK
jgi:two-component system chemotaxis response regulator CheB